MSFVFRLTAAFVWSSAILSCTGSAGGGGGFLEQALRAEQLERTVLVEHRRISIDGETIEESDSYADVLPDDVLDEVVGLRSPPPGAQIAYRLEVGRGQEHEDAPLEAFWRIVAEPRHFLSVEERVSRVEERRALLIEQSLGAMRAASLYDDDTVVRENNRSLDELIMRIRTDPVDPPMPAVDASDLVELGARGASPLVAEICGAPLAPIHLPRHLLKLDLLGDVHSDRAAIGRLLREQRATAAAAANETVAEEVERVGGTVFWRSDRDSCVVAEVPSPAAFLALADSGMRRVSLADLPTEMHTEEEFHGDALRLGLQVQQFWDGGFFGETPSSRAGGFNDLTAGIVDAGFQDRHVGWQDTSSATSTGRIKGRWHCSGNLFGCGGSSCANQSDLPWLHGHEGFGKNTIDHGTTVASIIMGDFTQGQESSTTLIPMADRSKWTGYAPEAGVAFLQGGNCPDRAAAINRGVDVDVDLISMSVCGGQTVTCGTDSIECSHQCRCDGDSNDLNDEVNNAFKDGVLVIKAAGNQNAPVAGCCECTVTSPGDAEGALAVGGTGTGFVLSGTNTVRKAANLGTSSRGLRELRKNGGAREGTVVAISAPRCRGRTAACQVESSNSSTWGTCTTAPCPCSDDNFHNYRQPL
jgi:hypothetical protein